MRIENLKFKMSNTQYGFTFIELILYVSIVTLMLTSLIPFAWNIIGGSAKSITQEEVFSQGRFISERLKYEIRNAADIDSANSDFDVNIAENTTKKLTLLQSPPINSSRISVAANGRLQFQQGADPPVELSSQDVIITDLTFSNYSSSDGKSKHVGFTITVATTNNTRQEYAENITIKSSAEIRNN